MGYSRPHHHLLDFQITIANYHANDSPYQHFNVQLIHYKAFCQFFWCQWRLRKEDFENLAQWWEVGSKLEKQNFQSAVRKTHSSLR